MIPFPDVRNSKAIAVNSVLATLVVGLGTLGMDGASAQGVPPLPDPPAEAAAPTPSDLELIRAAIAAQEKRLREQAQLLEKQRRQLEAMQARLNQAAPASRAAAQPSQAAASAPQQTQASRTQAVSEDSGLSTAGEVAENPERIDLSLLADGGGVLTPKGTLVVEPQLEYTHSSSNRFFFQGVEFFDTALVGVIEATEASRDSLTAAVAARYGLTNRLEADIRVPYLYRSDRVTNTIVNGGGSNIQNLEGYDLGDVELGIHYQLNRSDSAWPVFVGNLRAKLPTGKGPYDVDRDTDGLETELPTGSGFWGVEPSITVIYPSDPAVLYANLGYVWNIKSTVDEQIGSSFVSDVDPGDAISGSFGIGLSLNETTSISFGYQHDYVFETETVVDGTASESETAQVGSFLFGVSHSLTDDVGVNLNFSIGATSDAPEVRSTVRVPVTF